MKHYTPVIHGVGTMVPTQVFRLKCYHFSLSIHKKKYHKNTTHSKINFYIILFEKKLRTFKKFPKEGNEANILKQSEHIIVFADINAIIN